jgi:hypothetical protein
MEKNNLPPAETFSVRCPRLGHQITFSYCRIENKGLPCFKTLDCWFQHFSVEAFLRRELTSEEWHKVFGQSPKAKVLSLFELIEAAKKRDQEEA